MVIELDMESEVPIYVQLRNQIVKGIGKGELKAQEKLPTVRQLAAEAGVNTMTVNKAYQILKAEGYIKIDRRHGAVVADFVDMDLQFREKLEAELELLSAEYQILPVIHWNTLQIQLPWKALMPFPLLPGRQTLPPTGYRCK